MLRTNEPGQLPASLLRVVSPRVTSGGAAEGGGRRCRAAWRAALSRRLAGGAIAPPGSILILTSCGGRSGGAVGSTMEDIARQSGVVRFLTKCREQNAAH